MAASCKKPSPTVPPPLIGLYGSPWNADGLSNAEIGGGARIIPAIRFRAEHSGTLSAIKLYFIFYTAEDGRPGYGKGDGGDLRIEVRTDDGTVNHFPSSTVLSTLNIADPMNRDRNAPVYAEGDGLGGRATVNYWEMPMPPASLVAGQLYHIVLTNTAPDPVNNYVSINSLYNAANTPNVQPGISDTDLRMLEFYSGAWRPRNYDTPIYEVHYTDGAIRGQGYYGTSVSFPNSIYGVNRVRETFVPPATRSVSSVRVRLRKVGAPGPLTFRLERGDGTLVESGTLPSSAVPTTDAWVTYTFAQTRTLTGGQRYNLVLSATGDASNLYSIFQLLDGNLAHFRAQPFPEGTGEIDTGTGWHEPFQYAGSDWQAYLSSV